MDSDSRALDPAAGVRVEPDLDVLARQWSGGGWRRFFFPAFWLVYLGQAVDGVSRNAHGAGAVVGYVLVVAFAAVYLAALPMGWGHNTRLFWILYVVGFAITGAEALFAHGDAFVFCVYLAVLTVAALKVRAIPIVVTLTLISGLVPRFVPGWGGTINWANGLSVLLVSLAMFGFFKVVESNIALAAAR
ncbi:MAG: two-component system, NarL family, sensor histidine kinase DesK, partial [Pseudonocardiales bacterium]|nr:two-component system, NarL family, sensor histidine kinase DesK [Pseudonocardiales bacterium]